MMHIINAVSVATAMGRSENFFLFFLGFFTLSVNTGSETVVSSRDMISSVPSLMLSTVGSVFAFSELLSSSKKLLLSLKMLLSYTLMITYAF